MPERSRRWPRPGVFALDLRPYQLEAGLAQHLRKHELGGISPTTWASAETAQTLAHLLTEKRGRRLANRRLVVLPTSLVFSPGGGRPGASPDLKGAQPAWRGPGHAFAKIPDHDVCSPPTRSLWRDRDALLAARYHS